MANNGKKRKTGKAREIAFTGMMTALVFVFTYTLKIPLGTGYAHLGDMFIFLSIAILGMRDAAFAAALGAVLADFAGGYAPWILPTLIIKALMVIIIGLLIKAFPKKPVWYIISTVIGGAFQIGAYTLAKVILYDRAYAITTLPDLAAQTALGIAAAAVLYVTFEKTGVNKRLRTMAG